jgi:surfactin synthase thioesterase subunit
MAISERITSSVGGDWFGFPKPNPAAKVRLFCFPYAGSGANIFYKWPGSLPDQVELCLVQLPGRAHRQSEPPFDEMSHLVRALERPLLPYLDMPMAFFGHSMGALISFEISRHLRREYGVQPAQLFISGCGARQRLELAPPIHSLEPAQFLSELRLRNFTSIPASDRNQLQRLMLHTLQADFAVCETYSYAADTPLDCAITVYGGLQDPYVRYEYLEDWRKETIGRYALHLFRGDHFFIHSAESLVLKELSKELQRIADDLG